jgi:hypothetical protein
MPGRCRSSEKPYTLRFGFACVKLMRDWSARRCERQQRKPVSCAAQRTQLLLAALVLLVVHELLDHLRHRQNVPDEQLVEVGVRAHVADA